MSDEGDDLLDPSEIEALLADDGDDPGDRAPATPDGAAAPPSSTPRVPSATDRSKADDGATYGPGEIEELLRRSDDDTPDQLLDKAASGVAAAAGYERRSAKPPGGPEPFCFEEFNAPSDADRGASAIESLQDVELDLRIELGRTELLIEEVLRLKSGSVVALDRLAGDPVDILVNGRLVGRGEVLILNDNFCVRVDEILVPET